MGFLAAIRRTCFTNLFDVQSRACRSEYWWFFLLFALVQLIFILPLRLIIEMVDPGVGIILLAIIVLIPSIWLTIAYVTVAVRRLHDHDRSGWWYLAVWLTSWLFIPLIAFYIYCALPGTPGANRFGPNPLDPLGTNTPDGLDAFNKAMFSQNLNNQNK